MAYRFLDKCHEEILKNIEKYKQNSQNRQLSPPQSLLKYLQITYMKFPDSLGPVYEFVCVSFTTGNLNCFRVK
jgi:hypothetical protein